MKIKTVESFTLDECREYLKNHPERDDVRERMEWLERQEAQKSQKEQSQIEWKREEQKQKQEQIRREIEDLSQYEETQEQPFQDDAASVRWIDKRQFLETRRFGRMFRRSVILRRLIKFFGGLIIFVAFPLFLYSVIVDITDNPFSYILTSGLVDLELIEINKDQSCYYVGWLWGPVAFIAFSLILVLSVAMLVFSSFPLLKAYNVEDRHYVKTGDYILMQNKEGKIALCKVLRVRIRQVLGFCHDSIRACGNGSYICQIGSRYGLYNTDLKKMMLPVEYDNIKYTEEGNILAVKDAVEYRFTGKGYRIIN